jgi:hypothetical protein
LYALEVEELPEGMASTILLQKKRCHQCGWGRDIGGLGLFGIASLDGRDQSMTSMSSIGFICLLD